MMHGDFHVKNVMIQDGECLLIDMDTLCTGDPIYEFAGMYLPYVAYAELDPEDPMKFFGISYEMSHRLFYETTAAYFKDGELPLDQVLIRARILAYTRLLYYCAVRKHMKPEQVPERTEFARTKLLELLPQTDELSAHVTY